MNPMALLFALLAGCVTGVEEDVLLLGGPEQPEHRLLRGVHGEEVEQSEGQDDGLMVIGQDFAHASTLIGLLKTAS